MSELKEFRLPDVGEGLTEADIVSWHVKPGDTVKDGQIIVEIETAKAIVELPSPYNGTVTRLLVQEGQTVDVGAPIISVDLSGGPAPAAESAQAEEAAEELAATEMVPEPKPERQPVLVGYGVKEASTTRRPRRTTTAPSPAPTERRNLTKPPVRKLAKDLGVSLESLTGTGPAGSITRDDVHKAATGSPLRYESQERIPVRGVRKHMAAAMVASAFTAPHVTEFLQIDITETMSAVRRVRELPEFAAVRVSPLLFVARALLTSAARNPLINSTWGEDEIVVHQQVNLGIAVASERGLIVPNVKDAGSMSMPALAAALHGLTETARAGKSTPADLSGGTITITNVGVFGVDAGTPILSPGEAAILAFGQVKDAPWVIDGQLAVRKVCTLSLSFDHRIIDGELGSAALRDVGSMLTDPVRLLAWT
jgi:2-oxoisovalerate dehydrogenase E2 component (dihydrolipoyl transacylase)